MVIILFFTVIIILSCVCVGARMLYLYSPRGGYQPKARHVGVMPVPPKCGTGAVAPALPWGRGSQAIREQFDRMSELLEQKEATIKGMQAKLSRAQSELGEAYVRIRSLECFIRTLVPDARFSPIREEKAGEP